MNDNLNTTKNKKNIYDIYIEKRTGLINLSSSLFARLRERMKGLIEWLNESA